jgi:hypothetical protein
MQILKGILVVCAATFCTVVLPLRAADTDTDIKLRKALEKKLNEMQTQPPAATPQSTVTTPKPKTPAAPATAPTTQASGHKTAELPIQPGGRPTPPGQWTPPPVGQPPPAAAQPATAVSPPVDQKSIDKARETLHQQMAELEKQPAAATNAPIPSPKVATSQPGQKPVEAKPQETTSKPEVQPKAEKALKKPAKGAPAFPPVQPPPPAISADKEALLAELLRKYKADEVTPEAYHQQRAKILSGP